MPARAIDIPRQGQTKVIEPFQHPAPKLVMEPPSMQPWSMTAPSMSPLHMTPPNMELPNFSPIQDHMPLPTLSASTFTPPQSFLTYQHPHPISVVRFCRHDPTLLVAGSSSLDPEEARPMSEDATITVFRVEDVSREVRGDDKMIARGVYEVRQKIRPRLHVMTTIKTPGAVLDLVFSPHDPELLLATLSTGLIIAYRTPRGRYTIKQLSTHAISRGNPIHSLTFSPTSRTLAAATTGSGAVFLLNVPASPHSDNEIKTVTTINGHASAVFHCAFSADGKRLYTGDESGVLSSWAVARPATPKQKWTSTDQHPKGVTALLPWPAPFASDVGKKLRLLLTGSYDGNMRVLDMSSHVRPPYCRQELDLAGCVWRFAPLPALPVNSEINDLGPGAFCAALHPEVELDPEQQGVLAASTRGGSRVVIHKQKFEEVFLPRRDGSDIVDWTTSDGVKMDHEGREKQYYWYDLADIEEHGDSEVYAGDAVAVIDYDPLFKDAGEQRLRRGWRLVSASRDGTMCFWQVYVE